MTALGLDGCRAGWIAVWIDKRGRRGFAVIPTIANLASFAIESARIDMPIGLPDTGERACDFGAREILGPARSCVFLGARRPLLQHLDDHAKANEWAKADGRGLSIQMFRLLPKIAELDDFMSPARQHQMREAHPELVFRRLAGGTPLSPKKTPQGQRHRRDLVREHGFAEIDEWLGALRGTGAKPDDLLDACALAYAALEPGGKVGDDATDAKGLRMEIWF
jgi:predicted RNase H-like nuclease